MEPPVGSVLNVDAWRRILSEFFRSCRLDSSRIHAAIRIKCAFRACISNRARACRQPFAQAQHPASSIQHPQSPAAPCRQI